VGNFLESLIQCLGGNALVSGVAAFGNRLQSRGRTRAGINCCHTTGQLSIGQGGYSQNGGPLTLLITSQSGQEFFYGLHFLKAQLLLVVHVSKISADGKNANA